MVASYGTNSIAAAEFARSGMQKFASTGAKTIRRILLAMVLALGLPSAASALTISADADTGDCFGTGDDCVGGLYEITLVEGPDDFYTATITADYTGLYDLDIGGNAIGDVLITHVELKVSNEYIDPLTSSGGPVIGGPLNGGGCNGNNEGFLCVELSSPASAADGETPSWEITFGATDLLDEEEWHLGMRFEWEDGKGQDPNTSLLSASAAAIPEPSSAVLFALGSVLVVGAQKRRI